MSGRLLMTGLARRPDPQQTLMVVARRSGDQLVITKLDRLGPSLKYRIELSKELQDAA